MAYKNFSRDCEISNVLYSMSYIASGEGMAVVCAVGANTQFGLYLTSKYSIESLNLAEEIKFHNILENYSVKISKMSYFIGFLFGVCICCRRYAEDIGYIPSGSYTDYSEGDNALFLFVLNLLIIMLTLIIACIPEAITLSVIYCLSEYANL